MDIKLLKDVIEKEFNSLPVNNFYGHSSSIPKIVKDYIVDIDGLEIEQPTALKTRFIFHGENIGGISGQTILTNKRDGMLIARDKFLTEEYLKENEVKTTNSKIFTEKDLLFAKNYIAEQHRNMVVKPYNLSSGKGITLDVNLKNFNYAWEKAISAYENTKEKVKIIIQEQLPGIEARFLVIEGKFNSAILRVPTNIVGDGEKTVRELIKEKNLQRGRNPHLYKVLIKMDDVLESFLKDNKLNYNSIIPNKEVLFFWKVSNIALGGDTLEISHLVSNNLKTLAEKAVKAIPELHSAGVDIMFESFEDKNAAVLEVNHAANLIMHHYPWKGTPKKPILDLIDTLIERNKFYY